MVLLALTLIYLGNSVQKTKSNKNLFHNLELLEETRTTYENEVYDKTLPTWSNIASGNILIRTCTFSNNQGSNNDAGALHISGSADVIIEGCSFISNKGTKDGGALFISVEKIQITGSNFTENECNSETDTQSRGGSIFYSKPTGEQTISSCIFTGNKAKTAGGAIFVEFTSANTQTLKFTDCQFIGCSSSKFGGSISTVYTSTIPTIDFDIQLTDCQFTDNLAQESGGSIYIPESPGISLSSCKFIRNNATENGGCIYYNGKKIDLNDCFFNESQCIKENDDQLQSRGGAIFLRISEESTISSSSFHLDRAKTSGGALFIAYNQEGSSKLCHINHCSFYSCSSQSEGGAIMSGFYPLDGDQKYGNTNIEGCNFYQCQSARGGALYFQDGTKDGNEETRIISCLFDDCYASGSEHEGYSIYCRSYSIYVDNCTFVHHKQGTGVNTNCIVYIQTNENEVAPTVQSLTFEDNTGVSGLVIKTTKITKIYNITFNNIKDHSPCINLDNWATEEGVIIEKCTFSNIENARCVVTTTTTTTFEVNVQECHFINNTIRKYSDTSLVQSGCGSCILSQNKGQVEVVHCEFTNCLADYCGGAIYAETSSVNIFSCRFTLCRTSEYEEYGYGGAVYLKQTIEEESNEQFGLNSFFNCSATTSGGALFIYCVDIHTANSKKLTREGDNQEYQIFIAVNNFTDCSSGVEGGAICSGLIDPESNEIKGDNDLQVSTCIFTRCESAKGGALYFQDGTREGDEETSISACSFYDCYASGEEHEGYAIHCRSYQIKVNGCSFYDHKRGTRVSTNCIAYIETNEAEVTPTISGLTFERNTGVSGLVVKTAKPVTITMITFNDINDHSPCINLDNWAITETLTLEECVFSNIQDARCIMTTTNTGKYITEVQNCHFINNTIRKYSDTSLVQSGCGSCILSQNKGQVEVVHCEFTNCLADYCGGAIYAETSSINIFSCRFTLCRTSEYEEYGYGGAVYLKQTIEEESNEQFGLNSFFNCSATTSGGALFIYCVDIHTANSKKLTREGDNQEYQIFIAVNNFTDCSSGVEGGAICSGLIDPESNEIKGDNDLQVSTCIFTRCESAKGGALYFQDGTREGDEETSISACSFYDCYASGEEHEGYAIHCRSYQIKVNGCSFYDHKRGTRVSTNCIAYIETNEAEVTPTISGLTFERNTGVSGLVVKTAKPVTITMITFNDINDHSPCINLDNWAITETLTLEECVFSNIQDARCIMTTTNTGKYITEVQNCHFINNTIRKYSDTSLVQSGCGSCILSQNKGQVEVVHCEFTNCLADYCGGAIYAETSSINIFSCRFTLCRTSEYEEYGYGGAVYLKQTIEEESNEQFGLNSFFNCSATTSGGALFIYCVDIHTANSKKLTREGDNQEYQIFIAVNNFTDCSSGVEGGAICSGLIDPESNEIKGDNDLQVSTCIFTRCESAKGGALYFQDGTREGDEETSISACSFYDCYASGEEHEGYAIHCRSYQIKVNGCSFYDHKRGTRVSTNCIAYIETNEAEVTPTISGLTFERNTGVSGLVVKTAKPVTITMITFNDINDHSPCINLDNWAITETLTLEECVFSNIQDARCIMTTTNTGKYITEVQNCHFINNTIRKYSDTSLVQSGCGSCILSQNKGQVEVVHCEFTNCLADYCGGAIYAETSSINIFSCRFTLCRTSEYEEYGYGGAVYLKQTIEEESNEQFGLNSFFNCSATTSGGALFIYCVDIHTANSKKLTREGDNQEYQIFIAVNNFTDCSSGVEGGAICSGLIDPESNEIKGDNDLQVSTCIFTRCESAKGGALYFQDGTREGDEETSISACSFYDCYASGEEHEGYAIHCRSYQIKVNGCSFYDHKRGTRVSTNCIAYIETNEAEVTPTISGLTFERNTGVSGLVVKTAKPVTITMITFNDINDHSPCINLDNWAITETLTLEECVFSNIQDARCIMTTTNTGKYITEVQNCHFINNTIRKYSDTSLVQSGCGSCILSQNKGQVEVVHCEFTNCLADYCGGAIYAETSSINIFSCRFTLCRTSEYEEYGYGGAVYLKQTIEEESNEQFGLNSFFNCSATTSGGALFIYCVDIHTANSKKLTREGDNQEYQIFIAVNNFTDCSSGVEGGAICSGLIDPESNEIKGDNDLQVSTCIFTRCESAKGGALYFQDGTREGDEETSISACSFYDCYASGEEHEGYAIHCRSYQIKVNGCSFYDHKRGTRVSTNCIAYIETNEAEVTPTISGLTFERNTGVSGLVVKTAKPVTITMITFNDINDHSPCINLDNWAITETLTLEECVFSNIQDARCIMTTTNTGKYITEVQNCHFINNTIRKYSDTSLVQSGCGSCILSQNKGQVEVVHCEFTNCLADYCGGAIYAETSSINIFSCRFTLCRTSEYEEYGYGGAVYLKQTIEEESNEQFGLNSFFNCSATTSGGALFIYCVDIHTANSKKLTREGDNQEYQIFIAVNNFTDCSSGVEGGAICSGLIDPESNEIKGDNDLQVSTCIFTRCESAKGGALYFQDGTREGDEETSISACSFYDCYASGEEHEGYAIHCRSYQIKVNGCSFYDHKRGTRVSTNCIAYIETNEAEVTPTISGLTFERNTGVSGLVVKTAKPVTITMITFNDINDHSPCINLDNWAITETLTLEECVFSNIQDARCIMTTTNTGKYITEVQNCHFINNTIRKYSDTSLVQSGCGSCILSQNKGQVEVVHCEFTNCLADYCGGAIYAETSSINIFSCRFTLCRTSEYEEYGYGGAVYLKQTIEEESNEQFGLNSFFNCSATTSGGALFIYCVDIHTANSKKLTREGDNQEYQIFIAVNNFTDCSSGVEGGAICSGLIDPESNEIKGDNDLQVSTCIFTRCESAKGGALYFQDGTREGDEETSISACSFYDCYASGEEHEGYAIHCRSYQIKVNGCSFYDHKRGTRVSTNCIAYIETNEAEVTPTISGLTFERNTGVSGLVVKTAKPVTITMITFNDINDHSPCINLDNWAITETLTLEECVFSNIQDARCIMTTTNTGKYITEVQNCHFINNTIRKYSDTSLVQSGCGSCILSQNKGQVEVVHCEFTNCLADYCGGAIYAETSSINIFSCRFTLCRTSEYEEYGYGGAVYLKQTIEEESNEQFGLNSFFNCSATTSGGALFIYCVDIHTANSKKLTREGDNQEYQIFIAVNNFTDCSSGVEGGAICSGLIDPESNEIKGDNDLQVSTCIFTRCESAKGGALYFQDGTREGDEETSISACSFYDCYASGEEHEGYAIHCRSYQIKVNGCSFYDHKRGTRVSTNCIAYIETNEAEVTPTISGLTFERNTGVSGLVVKTAKPVTITMITFNDINDHSPCINLDNWAITETLTLEECVFSNIQDARCIMTTTNTGKYITEVQNCHFINNTIRKYSDTSLVQSGCGSCILSQNKGQVEVVHCEFTNCLADYCGGAIYAETSSINIFSCRFTLCRTSEYEEYGYGGAVYLKQTIEEESNEQFGLNSFFNCSATTSGGALFIYCVDIHTANSKKLTREGDNQEYQIFIAVNNFTDCSSGVEGGAICSGLIDPESNEIKGDNDLQVSTCIFTRCESAKGGALYFQDGTREGDEETSISACSFYDCYASGEEHEGYAIHCRSYQIKVNGCSFYDHKRGTRVSTNCIAYIETNEAEVTPTISGLTFERNTGVSGLVVKTAKPVTITMITFNDINDHSPCINLDNWAITETLTLEECVFSNIQDARCIMTTTNTEKYMTVLTKSQFINNSIRTYSDRSLIHSGCGSCILCQNRGNLIVNYCNFTNNMAESNGGAIFAETNAIALSLCRFVLCIAAQYEENGHGGAVYLNQTSEGDFEFCSGNIFINCSASYSGGGLFIFCRDVHIKSRLMRKDDDESEVEGDDNQYQIIVSSCNFTGCSSGVEGGALSTGLINEETQQMEGDNDLFVSSCNFERCESVKGGALYCQDGTKEGDEETNVKYCKFYDCYSTGEGHEGYAIHCRSYRIIIDSCEFYSHKPRSLGESGSILFVQTNEAEVTPNLNSLVFHENPNVPALVVRSMNPVDISNTIFSSTTLHINDEWNVTKINVISCKFQHNNGEKGGSVYISRSSSKPSQRTVKEDEVSNNTTDLIKFVFDHCQFVNSTAKKGGAIYAENIDQLILDSCSFYNSSASENGGAVYSAVYSELTSCNFSQTSSPKGAAIYAVLDNDIKISDITLDVPKEDGASAILISGGNSSNSLTFSGSGCFISSGKNEADSSADFIQFESEGSIKLDGDMCFSGSLDDSIKLPPGTSINQKGEWFNCNSCPAPPPPDLWEPSDGPIIVYPTPPSTDATTTPDTNTTDTDNKSKPKLSAGAIAGIVVGCVAFVAIVVAVFLFIRLRSNTNVDIRSEQIADSNNESTSSVYALDTQTDNYMNFNGIDEEA